MSPPPETVQWISEEVSGYSEGGSLACAPRLVEGLTLPVGLRVSTHPARAECGADWTFVKLETTGFRAMRTGGWYVPTKALTTHAPRPAWDKARPTGTAWIRQAGDNPTLGIPLDTLDWTTPALFTEGEPVERLAPRVVRTSTGRELWLDDYYIVDADPLAGARSASDAERANRRRMLHAGRIRHEKSLALAPVFSSASLGAAPKGQPFVITVDPRWLSQPRYSADWLDPVGHTLTHECKTTPKPFEPCGTYTLEYGALGAWTPDREVDVIALWNGKALEVLVLDPFGDRIGVTPTWDGRPDPTLSP